MRAGAEVNEWMNDGPDEVARCLANRLDITDDRALAGLWEASLDGEGGG
jgi:hypothetical protein